MSKGLRRSRWIVGLGFVVGAVAVAGLGGPVESADAQVRVKAKVLTNNQGLVWQNRRARVTVKLNRPGRARMVLIAGRNRKAARPIGRPRQIRLTRKRRRLPLRVAPALRGRLANCANRVIGVQVRVKPRRGKARVVRRVRPLRRTFAACSVGSENPASRPYFGPAIPTPDSARCDLLSTASCLQPWPSDHFTVASGATDTGKRLNLHPLSTPASTGDPGSHIDPTPWNRSDGFSPGSTIVLKVPAVEIQQAFNNTGFVPVTDLQRYTEQNQPVVLLNAATGERHPIWAELDSRPFDPSPGASQGTTSDVNLLIHPAKNLDEGARYIVALRNLRNAQNQPVAPPLAFRAYRDRLITKQQPVESRRSHMESLFTTLQSGGIQRANLYLAWDFTAASQDGIARWMLDMRDHALGNVLGDPDLANGTVEDGTAPSFTVTNVNTNPGNANFLRVIDGTIDDIPCYLVHPTSADNCAPGAEFAFSGPNDLDPNFIDGATTSAQFRCAIPSLVTDGLTVDPSRAALFGHGLLGQYTAVTGSNEVVHLMGDHNYAFCAVSWAGFSDDDGDTVLEILQNMSKFPKLPDRVQQGYINFMFLGRAMLHSNGFNSHPAFQVDPSDPQDADSGGDPVFDTSDLFFEGISQGAVLGGGLTAVSPDISRSVLHVGGMRYSLLLPRSTHWVNNFEIFLASPSLADRPLLLSMIQTLWDRGETSGYAAHATDDPYPNTPSHEVLLQPAVGDFQVANVAAEVQARTMGMSVYTPALDPGRHWEQSPFLGIPAIQSFPFSGSAMVYWDSGPVSFNGTHGQGAATPPNTNTAPRTALGFGQDPHGFPRRNAQTNDQIVDFFEGGFGICTDGVDLVTAIPCYANGWTGP